jgi:RNA binding exosome subunit
VGKGVVGALQTMESILNTDYSLAKFLNHIVAHLENEDKERACTLLDSRLEGQFRKVPQCDIE